MTRKQLPFFVAFIVLMFGVLACTCLASGTPVGGLQATANAALTKAAVGVATAGAQGNSLQATANAAGNQAQATANAEATSALATANAANSGNTSGEPTATTEPAGQATAVATDAGTGGNGNISGGPSDIPVVEGQNTLLIANDQLVSYQTKVDFAAVVKFYKDAMPKNGWTQDATASVETSSATVLAYKKDKRVAQVSVATDPTSRQTVVLIAIQ